MTLFTAFNVNGDAFLVECQDGFTLLVDGGESKDFGDIFVEHIRTRELPENQKEKMQGANSKEFKINLLVCTHEDSDHTEGIISILKQESVKVDQIWLPILWEEILCLVFDKSVGCHRLMKFIEKKVEKSNNKNPKDEETVEELEEALTNIDALEKNNNLLAIGGSYFDLAIFMMVNKIHSYEDKLAFRKLHTSGLMQLISRIVHVASLSKLSKGAKIEWLKYNPQTKYNEIKANSILPLSHEFLRKPSNNGSLRKKHKINDESIVCLFKGDGKSEPDILFCADSNLSDIHTDYIKKLNRNALITVPHHGAISRDGILDALDKCINEPYWVRGDSSRIKMGNSFLNISNHYKKLNYKRVFCTKCRKYSKSGKSQCLINCQTIELKYSYDKKKKKGEWKTKSKFCKCT